MAATFESGVGTLRSILPARHINLSSLHDQLIIFLLSWNLSWRLYSFPLPRVPNFPRSTVSSLSIER